MNKLIGYFKVVECSEGNRNEVVCWRVVGREEGVYLISCGQGSLWEMMP
jgi:hypothetical protein